MKIRLATSDQAAADAHGDILSPQAVDDVRALMAFYEHHLKPGFPSKDFAKKQHCWSPLVEGSAARGIDVANPRWERYRHAGLQRPKASDHRALTVDLEIGGG